MGKDQWIKYVIEVPYFTKYVFKYVCKGYVYVRGGATQSQVPLRRSEVSLLP